MNEEDSGRGPGNYNCLQVVKSLIEANRRVLVDC